MKKFEIWNSHKKNLELHKKTLFQTLKLKENVESVAENYIVQKHE